MAIIGVLCDNLLSLAVNYLFGKAIQTYMKYLIPNLIFIYLCFCGAIVVITMFAGEQIGYGIKHLFYICILDIFFSSLTFFITWQILKANQEKILVKEQEKQLEIIHETYIEGDFFFQHVQFPN